MAIIRYTRYPVAVFSAATLVAGAPAFTSTASPTSGSLTCVTGTPAVLPSDGAFPIPYFAAVAPAGDGLTLAAHYEIDSGWAKAHQIGSHEVNTGTVDGYAAMKCQYSCNANDACVSFTVSSQDPCALYDALIHPADFVNDDTVKSWGAYNKLCNPPSWPYTGTVKRGDATHLPARRDEKVIGPSLVDAADNCTETRVTPASTWVNYAPNKDFLSAHGHYTFTQSSTVEGAGFETTHRACHNICAGFGWCKAVFVSYVADVWGCTVFNVALTQEVFVEGAEGGKNTWPYGFNQQCPV